MDSDSINTETQYNTKAQTYSKVFSTYNTSSIDTYYRHIPSNLNNLKTVDMGCGDGADLVELQKRGATVSGVDSSQDMVIIAKNLLPNADIRHESFTQTTFNDNKFDWVISKWALQTHNDIDEVYQEAARLLKPHGTLLLLVTHPLRQFMEQREDRDYFSKRIVTSNLFENKVVVYEPNHTLTDYLSEYFIEHFELEAFEEGIDSGAEIVDGEVYPSFLLINAKKKGGV